MASVTFGWSANLIYNIRVHRDRPHAKLCNIWKWLSTGRRGRVLYEMKSLVIILSCVAQKKEMQVTFLFVRASQTSHFFTYQAPPLPICYLVGTVLRNESSTQEPVCGHRNFRPPKNVDPPWPLDYICFCYTPLIYNIVLHVQELHRPRSYHN